MAQLAHILGPTQLVTSIRIPGERLVTVDSNFDPDNGPYKIVQWDLQSALLTVERCDKRMTDGARPLPTRRHIPLGSIIDAEVLYDPAKEPPPPEEGGGRE